MITQVIHNFIIGPIAALVILFKNDKSANSIVMKQILCYSYSKKIQQMGPIALKQALIFLISEFNK